MFKTTAPIPVALPAHPHAESLPTDQRRPTGSAPPLHFSTKHYPASAHGDRPRRAAHTLPDGASPAGPITPPPDRHASFERTARYDDPRAYLRPAPPAQEFEYTGGPSQQAVLANMLSQRGDQVDQLRTQFAHAEARLASLSALVQAEARAEVAEACLAAIKAGWRGVESCLDVLSRHEAEARVAFVRTLGTGEVGAPPSVPVFGTGPTSPHPPVPLNVPNRVGPNTFPTLPPTPVVGGPSVIGTVRNRQVGRYRFDRVLTCSQVSQENEARRTSQDRRCERARWSSSPPPTLVPFPVLAGSLPSRAAGVGSRATSTCGPNASSRLAAFVHSLGTSEISAPAACPSLGPAYLLVHPSISPNIPNPVGPNIFLAPPPAPVVDQIPHDESFGAQGSSNTNTDELSVDEELP
ncbi:hypothetical protein FRC08_009509 [Ceratobasidium sp. 394]|nr:hypothetical protein FRC08_009509 [Ceratobasidium sp. 394]